MSEENIEKKFDTFFKINIYINIINGIFFYGRLIGMFDFKTQYLWICIIIFFSQIIILLIGFTIKENKLYSIQKSRNN